MNDETRKQIALSRYRLISPVLAEPGRVQNEYFRAQAGLTHVFPHYGARTVAVSTFKRWLKLYRAKGFEALLPKARADSGRPRRLSEESMAAIRGRCKAFPSLTVRKLYEDLLQNDQLGHPPVCYNTLLRTVHQEKLLPVAGRTDARKRFEHDEVNALWVCDFMHGPHVLVGNRRHKSILCAIIDDHSRMIVGFAFSPHETVSALIVVLKEAFLAYGLPVRLYVDNGPAFSSDLLAHSCALAGISLIHSKPYDSPSRGKIERFFRTVRERFLCGVCDEPTLDELNEAFSCWADHATLYTTMLQACNHSNLPRIGSAPRDGRTGLGSRDSPLDSFRVKSFGRDLPRGTGHHLGGREYLRLDQTADDRRAHLESNRSLRQRECHPVVA